MSYSLTDAGEDDLRAELKALDKLAEDIDQLASDARDCSTLAPKLGKALDLAWFLAEEALREAQTSSCGHSRSLHQLIQPENPGVKRVRCATCEHFKSVGLSTQGLRGRL